MVSVNLDKKSRLTGFDLLGRGIAWAVWVFACTYATALAAKVPNTPISGVGNVVLVLGCTLGTIAVLKWLVPDQKGGAR